MAISLTVPEMGESISEVEIGDWAVGEGDWIAQDDVVVVIETEKATMELPAPVSGVVREILKQTGETASVGETIGTMEEAERPAGMKERVPTRQRAPAPGADETTPAYQESIDAENGPSSPGDSTPTPAETESPRIMPAARRVLAEGEVDAADVRATGPGGRLLKEDALKHLPAGAARREEEVVPMSLMRRRIAERLVQAQHSAALLTTFNEVDMSAIIASRKRYQEEFRGRYGVKLGFMSFFVKAAIDALKQFPQLNGEIRDQSVVYKNYFDIGIAVGGGKGLVVPVLRNADRMSFAEVEIAIQDYARRAAENQLTVEELQGGTFTISNGGVYGSLLSTPIINPPQSGILGLHAIQERPVVRDGEIVAKPMMYVALTYDHRLVDGRESVTFLKRIKEAVEDPSRILLEI